MGAVDASVSEAIIATAFVSVIEDFKRFRRFLEPFDGLVVTRIAIRVVLHGQLAVSVGNLTVGCRLLHAEHFVIVAFFGPW